jgi:hypothetical protein
MMSKKSPMPNAQLPARVPSVVLSGIVNQRIRSLQSEKIGNKVLALLPDLGVGHRALSVERLLLQKVQ